MLESLGGRGLRHWRRARTTGAHHPGLVDTFVLDVLDAQEAETLRAEGIVVTVLDTVMRTHDDRRRLAIEILSTHLPD